MHPLCLHTRGERQSRLQQRRTDCACCWSASARRRLVEKHCVLILGWKAIATAGAAACQTSVVSTASLRGCPTLPLLQGQLLKLLHNRQAAL